MKPLEPLVGYATPINNCRATLKVEELELDVIQVTLYDTYECSTLKIDKETFKQWLVKAVSKLTM